MKRCIQCSQEKPKTEFYRDANSADGHRSNCKTCKNTRTAQWREANRDKYNAYMRDKNAARYPRDRLRRYGLTLERYEEMLKEQDGLCAICRKPPQGKRPLVIDHDHKTGRVRGLLCYGCNRALAVLDSPVLLGSAQAYLKVA